MGHYRYLNGNSLSGPIPSELGALTALNAMRVPSLPSSLVALLVHIVVFIVEEEYGVASFSPPLVVWSTSASRHEPHGVTDQVYERAS